MAKQKNTATRVAPGVAAEAGAPVTAPVVVDAGAATGEKPEELTGDAELPVAGGADVVTGEPGQVADGLDEDGAAVTAPAVVDVGTATGEETEELTGDAELPIAGGTEVVIGEAGQVADGLGEDGGAGEAESAASPPDQPPQPSEPSERETVPALVLSDNHLGKVGQVIQVDAAHAEALRLGGLIDTHPNAIKAATPEE
ncbi:hypothetical protein ORG27_00900 [Stenotrophomonas lactitubi]|uniref:hypothetical protein n=1 Tax=Stenotrophomonas lactitubi TaxID=2045214 RepID=UPI002248F81A|nr:hypothetical protein [Stenotrophomonas lactitubi]MCX2892135.1 hypothetical protein [Stenotrophomonas lactitubi]